jgi:tetratricopeptide (TPR) repeat protein
MLPFVMTAWPQFLPSLEADTPEEFDDYLTVEAASEPKAILAAAQGFRDRWPRSAMLPRIYEMEFAAWRRLGDFVKAQQAAQAALDAVPGNLTVKADFAAMLANADPAEAERLAKETLAELAIFRVPRRMEPDVWGRISGSIRSQAHMTLGVVRFTRGDTAGALAELERADTFIQSPDPGLCLRLGRLYATLGRVADARRQFQRVIATGDPVAMPLAKEELQRMK